MMYPIERMSEVDFNQGAGFRDGLTDEQAMLLALDTEGWDDAFDRYEGMEFGDE